MNIEKFMNSSANLENKIYASSFKRSAAGTIDITIVLILRVLFAQILGLIFVNSELQKFLLSFKDNFGTEFIKNNPDHINFFVHSRLFIVILIFYSIVIFIGALYHALLNSSNWQATIGKRLFNIVIQKNDGKKIGFGLGLTHYFLSVLPFIFIGYLIFFQITNKLTFFQAITYSNLNIFLGILFLLWNQTQILTKKKTTAYDLICKTNLVNKKVGVKFPWQKEKISNFL